MGSQQIGRLLQTLERLFRGSNAQPRAARRPRRPGAGGLEPGISGRAAPGATSHQAEVGLANQEAPRGLGPVVVDLADVES